MKSILLVEDDVLVAKVLQKKLMKEGFNVFHCYDARTVKRTVLKHTPDCVLLDINLPGTSGYEVLSSLKKYYQCPVILLTSHTEEDVEIKGLKLGADDFVVKTTSFSILFERIKKVIDKKNQVELFRGNNDIQIGDLYFSKKHSRCLVGKKNINLSNDEFDMLYYFLLKKDNVISRDELYLALKGIPYDGQSRGVDVGVSRLRSKFESVGLSRDIISPLRGKGYTLISNMFKQKRDILSADEMNVLHQVINECSIY